MTEDNPPKLTVETDGIHIEVTDRQTAQAALPFVEGTLQYHLGEDITDGKTKRQQHQPVEVECQGCGYEWTYKGKNPRGSTCPGCEKYTRFEPPLDERGER